MTTMAIPETADDLADLLNDEVKLSAFKSDGGKMSDVVAAYAKASAKRDPEIEAQAREQAQQILVQMFRDNQIDGKPPVDLAPGKGGVKAREYVTINNYGQTLRVPRHAAPHAVGNKVNSMFESRADFWQTVNEGPAAKTQGDRTAQAAWANKRSQLAEIANSFGSLVPADGGFLIPEVMRDEILMLSLEMAIMRPRATVIPMSSLRLPIPVVDETTHVSTIRGGVQTYWTEEAATLTESQAAFSRVVLEAKKLTAYAGIPNELLADAPGFEAFMDQVFPEAIVFSEDEAFIGSPTNTYGSGVGEPLGWLNAPAVVKVDPATSSKVAWADVTQMFSQMLPSSLGKAIWVCSPDVFPQLAQMTFGTNGFPVFISVGGGGASAFGTILGRPVIISEKLPALGTDGALSLIDPSYYLIGDRQVMQADTSEHYLFGNDKTAYRLIERVDGRPWIQSALTPANGSANTLSAFVELSGTHT